MGHLDNFSNKCLDDMKPYRISNIYMRLISIFDEYSPLGSSHYLQLLKDQEI